MVYSKDTLAQINKEYLSIRHKYENLLQKYVYRDYQNEKAQEFAVQGFSRRLRTLERCIHNVFENVSPDREIPLEGDELIDLCINLKAFVIDVFGCVDNLAWVWVYEKQVRKDNGSPIPNALIGLRKKNKEVWKSFSTEFREHLISLDEWFAYLENYRHALAHRIPLYVPPYIIDPKHENETLDLRNRMSDALKNGDDLMYNRLEEQERSLGIFRPLMAHSFMENNSRQIYFHAQLIADFNTIHELGNKMLEERNR